MTRVAPARRGARPSARAGISGVRGRGPGRRARRLISSLLILALLSTSAPAATTSQVLRGVASGAFLNTFLWLESSGWGHSVSAWATGQKPPRPAREERQSERNARVVRVSISPGDVTLKMYEKVVFAALATDAGGETVGGVRFRWRAEHVERGRRARISRSGEFEANSPGTYKITAEGAHQRAETTVRVLPEGGRTSAEEQPSGRHDVSTRDLPPGQARRLEGPTGRRGPGAAGRAHAGPERRGKSLFVKASFNPPAVSAAAAPAAAYFLPADSWNENNYMYADDPGNERGDPPGGPVDGGAGNGNFQISAPVLALPGRGIDLSLGLVYNSRVWSKTGASDITFDADRDWPAPGWSLGFGRIIGMSTSGSMMLEADNTRHGFTGSVTSYTSGATYFDGKTTDGSFIDYWTYSYNGVVSSAWAKLPNGTVINYGAPGGGAVYPTQIIDANGNYLIVTYRNNQGPAISTVTDTLGRAVTFNYDANSLLSSVSAPGLDGAARTLVRLQYRWHTLGYNFAGLTPRVRSATVPLVEAVYYPGTHTGYWFGDGDSYSPYGMIAKVSERKGMGYGGTISAGAETRRETYSYPSDTYAQQPDAPTYQTQTETWEGGAAAAVTTYTVNQNATPRRVEVAHPDGARSIQLLHNSPGSYLDGLVYSDESRDGAGNLLQSSAVTWVQGDYSSPRPARIEVTNENNQTKKTEFDYVGSIRNQATETRDYDYGGAAVLRRTVTEYENGAAYLNRHIFNLVKSVTVFDGAGARVSRTEYKYDEGSPADTPNVTMHAESHNPYSPWYEEPCDCWYEYVGYEHGYGYYEYVCHSTCSRTEFDPSTSYRGNVTEVKTYADAANLTGAVTETRGYDMVGNMITASTSCCEQTGVAYTDATQYAYPSAHTRGSAASAAARVTTSATYNFSTGLIHTTTDANGRTSQNTYDPGSLRPQESRSPTLARTTYAYDDNQPSITATTTDAYGAVADVNVKYLDGRGRVKREEARGSIAAEWDVVETVYDEMGRARKQSRPYRKNSQSPEWAEYFYDALGRTKRAVAPDGSENKIYFNDRYADPSRSRPSAASNEPGETALVVDQWGRERWGRTDAYGRLAEVVEPDAAGGGSVQHNGSVTRYYYDTLGSLTRVSQGAQQRKFRYDSLGRLTHQKLAEMSATLDGAGAYVGAGGPGAEWGDVFTYDARSNPVSRTDARGVTASFNYGNDPLNRLQSVSYSVAAAHDTSSPIAGAATVTYEYRSNGNGTQPVDVTQVWKVTAAGVSVEENGYDSEGRLGERKTTLASRPSHPLTTNYTYDTLDRVASVVYPAQYPSNARKSVTQSYDAASRLSSLRVDNVDYASGLVYNAADQMTSVNVGAGVGNWKQEKYEYDPKTGLLASQRVLRAGDENQKLLHLEYDYLRPGTSAGRTGQLTRVTDLLNPNNAAQNRDRRYEYDALGRLLRASGGADGRWKQRYEYDRYGNRLNVYSKSVEQFVRHFFQAAYDRQPNSTELQQWTGSLRQAHAQGPSQLLAAARELGRFLFQSAEYAARNRSNRDFVYDLYKGYLQREPDGPGWDYWASVVPGAGREAVRAAFAESGEFGLGVDGLSPHAPASGVPAPRDGLLGPIFFDSATNRVNSPGWQYDAAGNQTKSRRADGAWQGYEYDAAGRLVKVKDASGNVVANYTYGSSGGRLVAEEGGARTFFAWGPGGVIAEYTEPGAAVSPQWSKNYVYLGGRLLATQTAAAYGEVVQYQHPDRLGTRLVSNAADAGVVEQNTLPFGTESIAETTGGTSRRFTSYDRSASTQLDYAANRSYDSALGRFTQVDPLEMGAVDLGDPQSLNLYAYCGNDPVNHVDPDGLFFGKLFKWISKALKWIAIAAMVASAVISVVGLVAGAAALNTFLTTTTLGKILGFVANIPNAIGGFVSGIPKTIAGVFNFAEKGTAVVTGLIGNGALFGGSAAAGAISNHLQRRGDGRGNDIDSALERVYRDALRRLDRPNCRKYIRGSGAEDPRTALKNIYRRHEIKFDPTVKDMGNAQVGAGSNARINIGYEFFKDNPGGFKGPKLPTARSARSLVLLHELRHAVSGVAHPTGADGKLTPNVTDSNEDFTKNILKHCF